MKYLFVDLQKLPQDAFSRCVGDSGNYFTVEIEVCLTFDFEGIGLKLLHAAQVLIENYTQYSEMTDV